MSPQVVSVVNSCTFNAAATMVKITEPNVSEKITAVNLFDSVCAIKFFLIINFIALVSKQRKMFKRIISAPFCRFKANKVRPKRILTRIITKISNISPKFK